MRGQGTPRHVVPCRMSNLRSRNLHKSSGVATIPPFLTPSTDRLPPYSRAINTPDREYTRRRADGLSSLTSPAQRAILAPRQIADLGTSLWTQCTNRVATYSTRPRGLMSLPWAAPEVRKRFKRSFIRVGLGCGRVCPPYSVGFLMFSGTPSSAHHVPLPLTSPHQSHSAQVSAITHEDNIMCWCRSPTLSPLRPTSVCDSPNSRMLPAIHV